MRKLFVLMTICATFSIYAGEASSSEEQSLIKKSTASKVLKFREPFREP